MPPAEELTTSIWPPVCETYPKTWLSPRPVPFPSGLVVKNGSKMWSRTSGGIHENRTLRRRVQDPRAYAVYDSIRCNDSCKRHACGFYVVGV